MKVKKKIALLAVLVMTLVVTVGGAVGYNMNKAKASKGSYDDETLSVRWYYDINGEYADNMCIPDSIDATSITIPKEVTYKGVTYQVRSLGMSGVSDRSGAFMGGVSSNCTVAFEDGSSVTAINPYAFYGCENIASVTLPTSIKEIGTKAFYGCRNLTTVSGVENVETLGDEVFVNDFLLGNIVLDKITSFGSNLFTECSSLRLTITNPNIDLSNQDFKPTTMSGYANSTAKDYYNTIYTNDSRWTSLDGTGSYAEKSFKVNITGENIVLESGAFKNTYYGLTGGNVQDLTDCATKSHYTLDGYYAGATRYYAYDSTNDVMEKIKTTFPTYSDLSKLAVYADDTLTLTAKFVADKYNVQYYLSGGTWKENVSSSLLNTNMEQYTYSTEKELNTNVEKTGYTFGGWFASVTCTGNTTEKITAGEYGRKEFYAKWTPIHYTIVFNGNGSTSGSMADEDITYDVATPLMQNSFAKAGYSFVGWNTKANGSGTAYADKASVRNLTNTNTDVILYAQWSADTNIIFNGNGNTSGTMDNQSIKFNVAGNLTANAFERTGYTFVGWNTKADGSGVAYADKASVKNLTTSENPYITLYAQWSADTNIIFDGNKSDSGTMDNQSIKLNVTGKLTENTFKKTGYTFAGWNTKADGSGMAYTDKQSVFNLTTSENPYITLYAQWSANTDTKYTVTYEMVY